MGLGLEYGLSRAVRLGFVRLGRADSGRRAHSHVMWFPADVIGLFSLNAVPFSRNVVLSTWIFSANPVPKKRMFSVPAIYVLGPLHVWTWGN